MNGWPTRSDRWFYIGPGDLEPAEFTPLHRGLWLELNPPAGWTRVSYDGDGLPTIHASGYSCEFALRALSDQITQELLAEGPPKRSV